MNEPQHDWNTEQQCADVAIASLSKPRRLKFTTGNEEGQEMGEVERANAYAASAESYRYDSQNN